MKNYIKIIILTVVLLLSCLWVGCAGGIPQEQYDRVNAQLEAVQAQVAELQAELESKTRELKEQNETAGAELESAQAKINQLQGEIGGLQEQYELIGQTPEETATNIVRHYHETHTYSTVDFYVCSDMAADVWNMLKTFGIEALIQVGNVHQAVNEITESDHAWVLAEIAPGQYLALETTGGQVVPGG